MNKEENLNHAREMILRAASGEGHSKKPDLVVLPEYFNTPLGEAALPDWAEDIEFEPGRPYDATSSNSPSVKMLANAAKETGTWIIGGSIPERSGQEDKPFNACTVYNPRGEMVARHRKLHLFDVDIPGGVTYKESDHVTPGSTMNYFDTDFARIGLGVCYDVRFPELAMVAARRGCQVVIYPALFSVATGQMHWEILQKSRAVDNQVFMGMCSPARNNEAKLPAYGYSTVVDPTGKILVQAGEDEEVIYADIDPAVFESARSGIPVTTQRRFDVYKNVAD